MYELLLLLTAICTGANCFVISALKQRVRYLDALTEAQHDVQTDIYGLLAEIKERK